MDISLNYSAQRQYTSFGYLTLDISGACNLSEFCYAMSMNEMVSDVKLVVALVALSAGELSEEELALWFTEHLV
jgi:hypothetical protein